MRGLLCGLRVIGEGDLDGMLRPWINSSAHRLCQTAPCARGMLFLQNHWILMFSIRRGICHPEDPCAGSYSTFHWEEAYMQHKAPGWGLRDKSRSRENFQNFRFGRIGGSAVIVI